MTQTIPMRIPAEPVQPYPQLQVGDKVKLAATKRQWTVRAVTNAGRFAILTQPFNLQRTVLYTVIDFDRGVRGRDNYYGLGYETPEDIASALHEFQHTEDGSPQCENNDSFCRGGADVSFRSGNHERLDFESVNDQPTNHLGRRANEVRR